MHVPSSWFLRSEGRLAGRRAFGIGVAKKDLIDAPVPAFLVEHPGAGLILIDTGFHPSVAVNPRQNLGRVALFRYRDVQMDPGQAVSAQLRERGLSPGDVRVVVMTHLHADHASAIAEFPDATFIVSKREWEAATDAGQRHGYVRRQFDHGFDYRLLDFDGPDASSFSGFGRSFDLFGDGSVRTVFTPGHTLGPHVRGAAHEGRARCSSRATRSTCARRSRRRTSPTASRTSTCSGARCARSPSTARRRRTR